MRVSLIYPPCYTAKMSTKFKRKSKAIVNTVDPETGVYEVNNAATSTEACPPGVYLRIEEATGVPSPSHGVTTDLYWQVDVGPKRATGNPAVITGSSEVSSLSALFHEDYVIRRKTDADQVLLTLRSSALGNACFGKVILDISILSDNGQKNGATGESLSLLTLPLVPYFKSNDPEVVYDMKVRIVAKLAAAPVGFVLEPFVEATAKQTVHVMPDPRGTLPGVPIHALILLQRSAGADKIAKGSLYIDSGGEAKVLVDGKIGKRKSFFSSGDAPSQLFPGVSAFLDSDSGLMERDAQEMLAKAAGSGASASSAAARSQTSLADLSKSPRASQRASLLFRGAPKVTEFDETACSIGWSVQLPVPAVAHGLPLPPSSSFANDNGDIFNELQKSMDLAFGIRHAITARCGLMVPTQTSFVVHPLGSSNVAPVAIQGDAGSVVTAKIVIDYSNAHDPTIGVHRFLDLAYNGASAARLSVTIFGAIMIGDGSKGKEWKAFELSMDNPSGSKIRQPLSSSIFGPSAKTSTFSTTYSIEATIQGSEGDLRFTKTILPVDVILPPHLASVNQQSLTGSEIDTLQMKSSPIPVDFIVTGAVFPGFDTTTLHNSTGQPLAFTDVVSDESSGTTKRGKSKTRKASAAPAAAVVEVDA